MERNALVIDDEKLIRWSLRECLEKEGYRVKTASDGESARKVLEEELFDLALVDYKLPDSTGLDLVPKIKECSPQVAIIMITAHSSLENAIDAMRVGVNDYITKPFEEENLLFRIGKVLESSRLQKQVERHKEENTKAFNFDRVIGESPGMQNVKNMVERVVEIGDATILISGESGTGKDVLAKAIHYNSPRSDGPYVNITCTAIPETLLESILFGHEKGAFTDARQTKKGLLEDAGHGTVFLDEIGDMTLYLQGKLLRFLEEKTIQRVGGNREIKVDVRVIAATNKDLKKMVKEGTFREDLYFRLKVIPIHMPPLRERKEDIPLLIQHFVHEFSRDFKKSVNGVTPDLLKKLESYPWPGNIRELKNTIERAMILGQGEWIDDKDLPMDLLDESERDIDGDMDAGGIQNLPTEGIHLESLEESLVRQALEQSRGNQTKAGQLLGLNRDQIRYRIEKFKIDIKEYTKK